MKLDGDTIDGALNALRHRKAVHIDKRASRTIKKLNSAGEVVGEVDSASVLASLLDAERIKHQELMASETREAKAAWLAVRERRNSGIPDVCCKCNCELAMTRRALHVRSRKRVPLFTCRACSANRASQYCKELLTHEQRSEALRKGHLKRRKKRTNKPKASSGRSAR